MTPACLLLLLAPLCVQDEKPDAARKAGKDLAEIKAAIGRLGGFRPRAQEIQGKLRAAKTPEEQTALKAEYEKLGKEFQALRDETVKAIDVLIAETTAALEKTPENPALLEARSEAHTLLGKNDLALDDLEKLAALRKDDVDLLIRVGGLQQRMNRYEAALATMEKVLEKKPEHTQSRAIQGLCLYAVHRFEEANTVLGEVLKKEDLDPRQRQAASSQSDAAKKYVALWKAEQELRKKEAESDDLPRVRLTTSRGVVEIELFENEAPNTVANFIELVTKKFYDGLKFHRIIPNFMAQGGCPKGNGSGDPGYSFKDELGENHRKHFRGSLSMANSGPNTNGSQFFITHLPTHWLNGRHTVFGRVTQGQEFVDGLQVGDSITSAEVIRKRDHEYAVKKMGEEKKEEEKK